MQTFLPDTVPDTIVREDPAWYGPMFPRVPDDLPSIWPDP